MPTLAWRPFSSVNLFEGNDVRGIAAHMKDGKPSKALGIVLALVLPCGTGHYYLGLPRRAVYWFAATSLGLVICVALMAVFGGTLRLWAFGGMMTFIVLGWAGPLVDLAVTNSSRFTRVTVKKVVAYAILVALAGIGVRIVVRTGLIEAFKIPSAGMAPTLLPGDHIFVDKLSYGPYLTRNSQRLLSGSFPNSGDAIVFEYPNPDSSRPRQDFIQRVIAVPGDTLELDNGHPIINGWRVPSCLVGQEEFRFNDETPRHGTLFVEFLGTQSYLTWFEDGRDTAKQGPYVVQPGEVWVLGDNRNNSHDSRYWNGGRGAGVPMGLIKGRAMFTWLAFGSNGFLSWERFGRDINEVTMPIDDRDKLAAGIRKCLAQRPARTVPPKREKEGN
jgi:signal peptidase I